MARTLTIPLSKPVNLTISTTNSRVPYQIWTKLEQVPEQSFTTRFCWSLVELNKSVRNRKWKNCMLRLNDWIRRMQAALGKSCRLKYRRIFKGAFTWFNQLVRLFWYLWNRVKLSRNLTSNLKHSRNLAGSSTRQTLFVVSNQPFAANNCSSLVPTTSIRYSLILKFPQPLLIKVFPTLKTTESKP